MSMPAKRLSTTAHRALVRSKLQQVVEQALDQTSDIEVSMERDRIIRDMDPAFRQEAALVLLDEAIHGLILTEVHRRRSVFEGKVTKSAQRFKEAMDDWVNGDDDALDWRKQRHIVDGEHTMRPIPEMTRPNLLFVAQSYDRRAWKEALRATFFRKIAASLPDDQTKVQDVMDEGRYAEMYRETFTTAPASLSVEKPAEKPVS